MKCCFFVRFSFTCFAYLILISLTGCDSNDGSSRAPTVFQIGDIDGPIAEGIGSMVNLIPYEGQSDGPIILQGNIVFALNDEQKSGMRATHEAGFAMVLLGAEMGEIESLHEIIDGGISFNSESDPVVLAYVARKESRFMDRVIVQPSSSFINAEDAFNTAENIVVGDLLTRPSSPRGETQVEGQVNVADTPISEHLISHVVPDGGIYNTTVKFYAYFQCEEIDITGDLSCEQNPTRLSVFLATAEDDWTPGSRFESTDDTVVIDNVRTIQAYAVNDRWCAKDKDGGADNTACRFINYPEFYQFEYQLPDQKEGTVFQQRAAPSATQGKSTSYTSGFQFRIGGEINQDGPGLVADAEWSNSVTTSVPPLIIQVGNVGFAGAFWRFMFEPERPPIANKDRGLTRCDRIMGQPQNGQTPDGKFSNAVQTIQWLSCPLGEDNTFPVKVVWGAEMVQSSEVRVWLADDTLQFGPFGGTCTGALFGLTDFCGCSVDHERIFGIESDFTYRIPAPPTQCSEQ